MHLHVGGSVLLTCEENVLTLRYYCLYNHMITLLYSLWYRYRFVFSALCHGCPKCWIYWMIPAMHKGAYREFPNCQSDIITGFHKLFCKEQPYHQFERLPLLGI